MNAVRRCVWTDSRLATQDLPNKIPHHQKAEIETIGPMPWSSGKLFSVMVKFS
uniref:Uncharacterized protein n=1 Tax=Rhizophora mucronata TaxID=61149 RepID=A0A2P2P6Y0_RHIMU